MEKLHIQNTQDTPFISLDPQTGKFEFFGRSYPDDARAIFMPVITWLDIYIQQPVEETVVDFKFTYFNTASSKMILEILDRLYNVSSNGKKLTINWHYKETDEDMLDAGEEYSNIIDFPFNFVPYSA